VKRRTNVPSPVDSLVTQVEQLQQTDSSVEDGETVWVRSTQCLWVYRVNSGLTPNGTDVVAALYGNGVWVRSNLTLGAAGDLLQTSWFIDPVNGNDTNSGATLALALKTDAERQRRWGPSTRLVAPTTVTYASSPPSTDKVNYDVAYLDGASLTVQGTPTIVKPNITLSAVTTLDRATQTPWDITGGTLGAADVGLMVRINQGARVNNYAAICKDLGGNKVRIAPFGNLDIANTVTLGYPFVQVVPQVNDVVDVIDVPTLTVGLLSFRAGTNSMFAAGPPFINGVLFDSVRLDGAGSGANTLMGTVELHGANAFYRQSILKQVRLIGGGGQWMAGGLIAGLLQVQSVYSSNGGPFCSLLGFGTLAGSLGVFTVQRGASCVLGGDCLFQNFSIFTFGMLYGEFVSVFDRSGANLAVQAIAGGVYRSRVLLTSDLLWGDGNAGVGVRILSASALVYGTKPTINTPQGAGRQSVIGGVNTDWAAVPVVTAANNAMIVVDA